MEDSTTWIEYYLDKINSVYMHPGIYLICLVEILIVFTIRAFLLINIEKIGKKGRLAKDKLNYVLSHCGIELIISTLVSYLIIVLTLADPKNYIINFVIAPLNSCLLGIYVDTKFLIPVESDKLGDLKSSVNKSASTSSSSKSEDNKGVTININNGKTTNQLDNDKDIKKSTNHIDKEKIVNLESSEFRVIMADSINEMKDIQSDQYDKIQASEHKIEEISNILTINGGKLDNSIDIIKAIKETEMMDKKIELKSMIYNCLNKGFATPEENDKITIYFDSYKRLGGNGEIEALYKDHYLKLGVHEDRRKNDLINNLNEYVLLQSGKPLVNKLAYGEYDAHPCGTVSEIK